MVYQAITKRRMELERDVLEKKRAFIESRFARGDILLVSQSTISLRTVAVLKILYILMVLEDVRQLRVYSYLPDLPG